ncbi:MAG: efflux RND transporter permease subunit, partial [Gemmatimonadota bacterium]|nr:efflux RND transporter permease subunit [Gemmatimonadota bacterium]
ASGSPVYGGRPAAVSLLSMRDTTTSCVRSWGIAHNTSFFSEHAMAVFAIASATSFSAQRLKDPHADAIAAVSFSLASAVGIGRIYQRHHWLSDVLIGAAVGSGAVTSPRNSRTGSGDEASEAEARIDAGSLAVAASAKVLLSLPFALVGGVWLMWALDYQLSVAVVIGFIALAGVAAETGVVMLLYLDQAYLNAKNRDELRSRADVDAAVEQGAVERVRPKMMTVTAIMAGLIPILWSQGTGADVMKRIAAPMVGGMLTSTLLTLVVIPAIYSLWKERALALHARGLRRDGAQMPDDRVDQAPGGQDLADARA